MSKKLLSLVIVLLMVVVSSGAVYASWTVNSGGGLDLFTGYVLGRDDNNGRGANSQELDETEEEQEDEFVPPGQAKIQVINAKESKRLIIRSQRDKFSLSVVDEDGQEESIDEGSESGEIEIEEPADKDKVKLRAVDNASLVIRNRVAAKTNFPLMVNLETNELIVTTPKGSKVVTVLPDAAVSNMLAANVLDQLGGKGGLLWEEYQARLALQQAEEDEATESGEVEEGTPSASQEPDLEEDEESTETAEASPSATPEPTPEESPAEEFVELTVDDDGELVYGIEGFKEERFFGVFKVNLKRKVYVSAETGELVRIEQDLRTRLIDALSF